MSSYSGLLVNLPAATSSRLLLLLLLRQIFESLLYLR